MQYPDEMYAENERRKARWAREDAAKARISAANAAAKGNHTAARNLRSWAFQKELDAEFHESQI